MGKGMTSLAPHVSVLMAVFDPPANYLDASIASILNQSYRDFEFVIVDDGSGEATKNLLQAWADRDQRVRLHRLSTNIGLTKALNVGLGLVRGDYVARQDADDISKMERLAAQKDFLELHPEMDAAGTNAIVIDSAGNSIGVMEIDPDLQGLAKRNLLVHGSMLFRRHVFDVLGGYDERMHLAQDYELYLRMLRMHGMKIGVLREAHYCLRQHPTSLSSQRMFRQLYYSVLAKTLNEQYGSRSGKKMLFYGNLIADYFLSHRLFLGPLMRSLIRIGSRSQSTKEMK